MCPGIDNYLKRHSAAISITLTIGIQIAVDSNQITLTAAIDLYRAALHSVQSPDKLKITVVGPSVYLNIRLSINHHLTVCFIGPNAKAVISGSLGCNIQSTVKRYPTAPLCQYPHRSALCRFSLDIYSTVGISRHTAANTLKLKAVSFITPNKTHSIADISCSS